MGAKREDVKVGDRLQCGRGSPPLIVTGITERGAETKYARAGRFYGCIPWDWIESGEYAHTPQAAGTPSTPPKEPRHE